MVTVPSLLVVAYVTVAERKTMASMQRRLGPNLIGYYGLLQAFADALKLLLKEYVSPTQSNFILFFLGPIITLVFSLLSLGVIPYGTGLTILDLDLGILYLLAVSSLATYGILLAGWSANSKYAFLGSLRSTAQLISYELILSSAILVVILLTGSLNLTVIIEYQKTIWLLFPLFPVFIVFFIGCIAETNRAPFDLAEAESELVSGFMTEHAAVIFVFFFLAEYASIVIICTLTSILFLGGYLINITPILVSIETTKSSLETSILFISYSFINSYVSFLEEINQLLKSEFVNGLFEHVYYYSVKDIDSAISYSLQNKKDVYLSNFPTYITSNIFYGLISSILLGIKTSIMVFVFIWARASFPRIRFDQLMSFCWTVLLPIVVAFIIYIPCILYTFDILPNNILLL